MTRQLFRVLSPIRCLAVAVLAVVVVSPSLATQVVFLDFDSRTSFPDLQNRLGYSAFERDEIVNRVVEDYAQFDFEFTLTQPTEGDFTTIWMNDGPAFGIAEQIDFRNINKNDNATVNVPFFATPTDQSRVLITSTVISHELGHILGLRHVDGFGPLGSGIDLSSFAVSGFEFPGPVNANEAAFHIMQTDADNGIPFETFFGEREAVKLSFNERGSVVEESTLAGDGGLTPVTLATLDVPNTLRVGDFQGQDFEVNAVTVLGTLDEAGLEDRYTFEAKAGDILNVEAISGIQQFDEDFEPLGRFTDTISPRISVLDAEGIPVDFFGEEAVNDLGPEFADALIIDLLIPADGTYTVAIDGTGLSFSDATPETGDYELFLYTFGVDTGVRASSAGDYNGDGVVNAADYTLFRDSLAETTEVGAGADGNANGLVDPEDYRYWIGNYGREDAASAGVPEPTACLLAALALAAGLGCKRS